MNDFKSHWRAVFDRVARLDRPEHELVGVQSPANANFIRHTVHSVVGPIRGLRILDAGSGEAQISQLYFTDNEVTCVDFSVCLLRRIGPGCWGRLTADLERLPFRDGSFDLVMCIETIQCLPELSGALGEFARVLRPDARLVISTLNSHSAMRRALRLLRPRPAHVLLRSPFRIAAQLRQSGFDPLHTVYLTHYFRMTADGQTQPGFREIAHSVASTNFIIEARKSRVLGRD